MQKNSTNVLLIGGEARSGKSQTILNLVNRFRNNGFIIDKEENPTDVNNFRFILKGKNVNGVEISVVLLGGADDEENINKNFTFINEYGTCDVIIAAIRKRGITDNKLRGFVEKGINALQPNFKLEVPLVRLKNMKDDISIALNWYQREIDTLIDFILSSNPFLIFRS